MEWHVYDPATLGVSVFSVVCLIVFLLVTPWLFEWQAATAFVARHGHWLNFSLPVFLLLKLIQQDYYRSILLGLAICFCNCTWVGFWSLPAGDYRPQTMRFAMPLGLLLMMCIRWSSRFAPLMLVRR